MGPLRPIPSRRNWRTNVRLPGIFPYQPRLVRRLRGKPAGLLGFRPLRHHGKVLDLAAATQQVLGESYIGHGRELLKRAGIPRIAMNSGVAANVKLNLRLAQIPEVEAIFVLPGMIDSGNSVGAALCAQEQDTPGFFAAHRRALCEDRIDALAIGPFRVGKPLRQSLH